ncbi:MAG: pseudoazurin [Gammaproteobacteria bacterium]
MMRSSIGKLVLIMGLSVSSAAFAEEHKVQMSNGGDDGVMLFEPGYIKVNVGDTVTFVAKDPGHNVISLHVPEGANSWKGKVSTGLSVTLNKEGVYLYECDLHKMIGMVGVIQVGKPVNLEAAKKAADDISKKMAMGAEIFGGYLAKVK